MFSQIIDQLEQENNWYKFGGATWCYKPHSTVQVTMMNKEKIEENFAQLNQEDLDLTMFTNLTLLLLNP